MAETLGEVPSGEKEFEASTKHVREIIEFPEMTEEEFNKLLKSASKGYGSPLPHRTYSLCPESRRVVPAVVWEKMVRYG